MRVNLNLKGSRVAEWYYFSDQHIEVWLYDLWDSGLKEQLHQIVANQPGEDQIISKIVSLAEEWNHPFALAVRTPRQTLIFADHIQSHTLLYYVTEDTISISDDPYSIVDDQAVLSTANLQGFMFTRYTLGDRTFIKNLFQIPAGQYLHITENGYELKDHYIYKNISPETISPEKKKEEIYETILDTFRDLLKVYGDTQLVLFLSGGYDSRLILWALDKLQAPNVLLCSYGRRWQRDVRWAKKFADFVPYKWVYVKKNYRSMRRFYQSREKQVYYDQSHKLCRKPNTVDMAAIKDLKRRGLVEDDAIFINGNSGGFMSGAHLEPEFSNPVSYNECANLLIKRHCVMWDWDSADPKVKKRVKEQIVTDLKNAPIEEQFSDSLYEWWVWRERQSKLMVSLLNEFIWHGHRLSMPLWDKRLIDIFRTVPFNERLNQKLFKELLEELTTSSGNKITDAPYTAREKASPLLKLRRVTEYFAEPKWGSYTIRQILASKKEARDIIGTRKLTNPPKIAGISNGLLVKEMSEKFPVE